MLPGRRRLQQGRRDDASSSSTPGRRDPPSSAALAALPRTKRRHNLKTEKLDEHVRESLSLIGRATFELNETLQTARSNLEGLSENKEEERARMQKKVTKLELLAKSLTTEAEQSVRQLVDLKAGVADEREVLRATHDATSTVARTRQQERMRREQRQQELAEAGEADEDGRDVLAEPLFHPSTDMIRELREQKASDYESMAAYQRYSLNNDYIEFKRQWHMGLHGADAIVPDAKRWFTHAGEPVFNYGTSGENGGDEDEEMADGDDDIVIERQKVSTRCPLSLQEMREPYTNSRCKHTFEKDAILEFLVVPSVCGARKPVVTWTFQNETSTLTGQC
ncbi:unnamed protein product [Parascedosporium putredinis]|uniref:SP-RING-type domain-containing protein n=1 Tax=Parascedosporium putredinis TaxID=1442378 RepID=A0A9P1H7R4_9PEZI|nr:unnamed protein product [Parascedosporium putredinis]CAI7999919.1 unnamed protein product [Parascedosporium putredinis]